MRQENPLIREIADCKPASGSYALWWLGQMGWVIKTGKTVIGVDLFLSPHPKRLRPPLIRPEEAEGFDLFMGTHDHRDHIDREAWPVMAKASPRARFILPLRVADDVRQATGLPEKRLLPLDDGLHYDAHGIEVTALPSAHEWLDNDPAAGGQRWLGYVIDNGAGAIYHSGDTCIWEGLRARLAAWRLLAALLPINGRDAVRYRAGVIGCMTYQEAGDLAGGVGAKTVFPGHFDAFSRDAVDPELFADYVASRYPEAKAIVAEPGRRYDIDPFSGVAP